MALTFEYKNKKIGVGDKVKVVQSAKEGEKTRQQIFEGIVIAIQNKGEGKSFTVRRIGAQMVGIERIFSLNSPSIVSIDVKKEGLAGVKRSKLYYIRGKSRRQVEEIYSRAAKRKKVAK